MRVKEDRLKARAAREVALCLNKDGFGNHLNYILSDLLFLIKKNLG
jgi:hypothetical protein